jgi:hypothetical protein
MSSMAATSIMAVAKGTSATAQATLTRAQGLVIDPTAAMSSMAATSITAVAKGTSAKAQATLTRALKIVAWTAPPIESIEIENDWRIAGAGAAAS